MPTTKTPLLNLAPELSLSAKSYQKRAPFRGRKGQNLSENNAKLTKKKNKIKSPKNEKIGQKEASKQNEKISKIQKSQNQHNSPDSQITNLNDSAYSSNISTCINSLNSSINNISPVAIVNETRRTRSEEAYRTPILRCNNSNRKYISSPNPYNSSLPRNSNNSLNTVSQDLDKSPALNLPYERLSISQKPYPSSLHHKVGSGTGALRYSGRSKSHDSYSISPNTILAVKKFTKEITNSSRVPDQPYTPRSKPDKVGDDNYGIDLGDLVIPKDFEIKKFREILIQEEPFVFSFNSETESNDLDLTDLDLDSQINLITNQAQKFKFALNQTKNNLKTKVTSKLSANTWHYHTSNHHITRRLGKILRQKYNGEVVTQAWCKFFEILKHFEADLNIEEKVGNFRVMHLCEAPGAFICCLNHFLRTKSFGESKDQKDTQKEKIYYNWLATTLNPYHELNSPDNCISDDTVIKFTQDKWLFGHSNTGDLIADQASIIQQVKEYHNIHNNKAQKLSFITADGGINCFNYSEEQEKRTYKLHMAEVDTALNLLENGGNFLIKMFTIFETETRNLLYNKLYLNFEEIIFFKPITSKPGNSEIYCFCRNKLEYATVPTRNSAENSEKNYLKFLKSYLSLIKSTTERQITAIQANLQLYYMKVHDFKFGTDLYNCWNEYISETLTNLVEKWQVDNGVKVLRPIDWVTLHHSFVKKEKKVEKTAEEIANETFTSDVPVTCHLPFVPGAVSHQSGPANLANSRLTLRRKIIPEEKPTMTTKESKTEFFKNDKNSTFLRVNKVEWLNGNLEINIKQGQSIERTKILASITCSQPVMKKLNEMPEKFWDEAFRTKNYYNYDKCYQKILKLTQIHTLPRSNGASYRSYGMFLSNAYNGMRWFSRTFKGFGGFLGDFYLRKIIEKFF